MAVRPNSYGAVFLLVSAFVLNQCAAPPGHGDASDARVDAEDAPPAECRTDRDCSDNIFCNGVERCMPGAADASVTGCLPGGPPCSAGQTCSEVMARCETSCTDNDHDGHGAIGCGGDDCNDNDPNEYPGNAEVCVWDAAHNTRVDPNHDEDCDPTTLASRTNSDGDQDHDTYIDSACCNTDRAGHLVCGDDCADTAPVSGVPSVFMTSVQPSDIHPTQAEVCNGVDDNCNGQRDEALPITAYFPDCDGDHFGDAHGVGTTACGGIALPRCMGNVSAANSMDCNDANGSVNPGTTEVCNGVDDNCDGRTDENLPTQMFYPDCDGDGFGDVHATGAAACAAMYAPQCSGHPAVSDHADCDDTRAAVHPGVTEICDLLDNDCNGLVDDGLATMSFYADCDGDGSGDIAAPAVVACGTDTVPQCMGHPAVNSHNDCNDTIPAVHPGVTTYATAPACPPGTSDCSYTQERPNSTGGFDAVSHTHECIAGTCPGPAPCVGFSCPTGPHSTWDYNCSGAVEFQPTSLAACGAGPGGICPPYTDPGGTFHPGSGFTAATTPTSSADCGTDMLTSWTCASGMFPGACVTNTAPAGVLGCR